MTIEGNKIITVGRFGQKCANFKSGGFKLSVPVWSAKIYKAKKNYKGELKWFFVKHIGRTAAGKFVSDKLINETMKNSKYPFMLCVKHLDEVFA